MEKTKVGKVSHYYSKIGVAVIEVEGTLKIGDEISIEGANTNFTQKIESMQIDRESIKEAKKGNSIGMKVNEEVRANDVVYKVKKK
jgi:putative protease